MYASTKERCNVGLNDSVRGWIDEYVGIEDWQWFGGAFAIEPRYVPDLVAGLIRDGFTLEDQS